MRFYFSFQTDGCFYMRFYLAISYECEGVFRIGVITFQVSISVNNASMKPNFSEIADFIAHELEIQSSQASLNMHFPLVIYVC